jgi:hypothetical protein
MDIHRHYEVVLCVLQNRVGKPHSNAFCDCTVSQYQDARKLTTLELSDQKDIKVTILLNTFKREKLLRQFISHYSGCSAVSRIHVNWAESLEPPDLSKEANGRTEVTFAIPLATHNDSSLNTRFHPVSGAPHILQALA